MGRQRLRAGWALSGSHLGRIATAIRLQLTSTLVLDACVLIALVLREPHAQRIDELIRRWNAEGATLNAPFLVHNEVASALTRHRTSDVVVLGHRQRCSSRSRS